MFMCDKNFIHRTLNLYYFTHNLSAILFSPWIPAACVSLSPAGTLTTTCFDLLRYLSRFHSLTAGYTEACSVFMQLHNSKCVAAKSPPDMAEKEIKGLAIN